MILKNALITFRPQPLKLKNTPLLKIYLSLLVISLLINCAKSGPSITGCAVNVAQQGFNCVSGSKKFNLTYAQGINLNCISPYDAEDFFKACKGGTVLPVTQCSVNLKAGGFLCTKPDASTYYMAFNVADNYFCVSAQDEKRIIERCHN